MTASEILKNPSLILKSPPLLNLIEENQRLGLLFRALREKKGLSLAQLAVLTQREDIGANQIKRIEQGVVRVTEGEYEVLSQILANDSEDLSELLASCYEEHLACGEECFQPASALLEEKKIRPQYTLQEARKAAGELLRILIADSGKKKGLIAREIGVSENRLNLCLSGKRAIPLAKISDLVRVFALSAEQKADLTYLVEQSYTDEARFREAHTSHYEEHQACEEACFQPAPASPEGKEIRPPYTPQEAREAAGKLLRKHIARSGKKNGVIAKEIGVSDACLSNYLSGKQGIPLEKIPELKRVLKLSDTQVAELTSLAEQSYTHLFRVTQRENRLRADCAPRKNDAKEAREQAAVFLKECLEVSGDTEKEIARKSGCHWSTLRDILQAKLAIQGALVPGLVSAFNMSEVQEAIFLDLARRTHLYTEFSVAPGGAGVTMGAALPSQGVPELLLLGTERDR